MINFWIATYGKITVQSQIWQKLEKKLDGKFQFCSKFVF